jgi:hypothetical protein
MGYLRNPFSSQHSEHLPLYAILQPIFYPILYYYEQNYPFINVRGFLQIKHLLLIFEFYKLLSGSVY